MGNYAKAEPLLQRALKIIGKSSARIIRYRLSLNNLARFIIEWAIPKKRCSSPRGSPGARKKSIAYFVLYVRATASGISEKNQSL